jgi:hypothetical protein
VAPVQQAEYLVSAQLQMVRERQRNIQLGVIVRQLVDRYPG